MHVRQMLREAVAEVLRTEDLFAEVFTNRQVDIGTAQLPAVVIITEDEDSENHDKDGTLSRDIQLQVMVFLDGVTEDLDDALDDACEAVERNMAQLFGLLKRIELRSTVLDFQPDEAGQLWYGIALLNYVCTAMTQEGEPGNLV